MKKASQLFFPLEKYDFSQFSQENCASFTGVPVSHPYEKDKFLLITDPLSDHTHFIEFSKDDCLFVEELPTVNTKSGDSITMSVVWIKDNSHAIRYEPFIVKHKPHNFTHKLIP